MMPISTKVVEEVEAKKESPARIANTEIDVQVLQWSLIFWLSISYIAVKCIDFYKHSRNTTVWITL